MIEIQIKGGILSSILEGSNAEEVEKILSDGVGEKLRDEILKHIDELDFIEMELNEATGNFEYQGELVLCSKNDIVTNAQIQAQKLSKYGLTPEQIVDVLDTITNNTEGF